MYGLDGAIPGTVDSTFCVLFAFDVMYSVLQVTISRGGGGKPFIIRRTQIWQIRQEHEGAAAEYRREGWRFEDMLKRPTAETVCGKQKCEMIIAAEEVIVFFLTQRKPE